MSNRLHRHATLLRALHRASPATRSNLLKKHCDREFVCCITECVKNLLKGNVPLNSAQKKKLATKKNVLRQLALKKTSLRKKTETDTERRLPRRVTWTDNFGSGN